MKDLNYRRLIPLIGAAAALSVFGCGGKATTEEDSDGGDGDEDGGDGDGTSPEEIEAKVSTIARTMCASLDECGGNYYDSVADCTEEYQEYLSYAIEQVLGLGFDECIDAALDYQLCYAQNYSCYDYVESECITEALRANSACEGLYDDYYDYYDYSDPGDPDGESTDCYENEDGSVCCTYDESTFCY